MANDSETDPFGNPFKSSDVKEVPAGTPRVVSESRPPREDSFDKYEYSDEPKDRERSSGSKPKKEKDIKIEIDREGAPGALKAMASFFTIFHFDVNNEDIESMERNFGLVPVIGFALGAGVFVILMILAILGLDDTLFLLAAIGLASVMFMTKFLHFDGLADFGDGMTVSGQKEDHIRALKDTTIGAGALGWALFITLISLAALTSISPDIVFLMMFIWGSEVFVKNAMVAAAAFGEPGNGMASQQVRQTNTNSLILSMILSFILAALGLAIAAGFGTLFDYGSYFETDMIINAFELLIAALIISTLAGYLMARVANKTFGFVNGDVLGATNEISRAAILVGCAIVAALIGGVA